MADEQKKTEESITVPVLVLTTAEEVTREKYEGAQEQARDNWPQSVWADLVAYERRVDMTN